MLFLQRKLVFCLIFLIALPGQALAYVSNGSDGVFSPESSISLDLPEDGVFNFTSIFIDSDVAITFSPNGTNAPIFLLATEDIIIDGSLDISDFFNGNGGNIVISTPGIIKISGSMLANGNPDGGSGGNITIESGRMLSIDDNAYFSVVSEASGKVSNYGSVTLTCGSYGNLIIDSTYESLTFDGVLGGGISLESSDLELNPLPVPSTIFLLTLGMTGLAGLGRRNKV
ncbi:MAG: PEP-CTERM sorting domain-containing protein [Desulfobacterales bacterium]|nr:PEP-CTERM sorting domain-containing protein [Desulfobacterales bacterium]